MKRNICVIITFLLLGSFSFSSADVPSTWAEGFVSDIQNQEILEDSFFNNYQSPITRKDFAYLGIKLYEEYTGKDATIGEANFEDTTDPWILKAKNTAIVGGYPDGTYKPNNNITRQELAVLFVNVFKASGIKYSEPNEEKFADDSSIANWAKEAVYIAKSNGIINGVGENTFAPNGNATKEQSLIMFNKGQTSEKIEVLPKVVENQIDLAFNKAIEFSNDAIVNVDGEGYLIIDNELPGELRGAVYTLKISSDFLYGFDSFQEIDGGYRDISKYRRMFGFILASEFKDDTFYTLHDKDYNLLGYTYFEEPPKFSNEHFYKMKALFKPKDKFVEGRHLEKNIDYKVNVDFPGEIRKASGNSNPGGYGTLTGSNDTLFFEAELYPIYSPLGPDAISIEVLSSDIYLEDLTISKY